MDHDPVLFDLVEVVQELSFARDLATVMDIARRAARRLTGADGASFILREGDRCYYADEDAISPLWKGSRFPMSACVSGWVMTNAQPALIPDVYDDERVPVEAYRPTFVKSLAIVPIRSRAPVGAIGNYWATQHAPTPREVRLLSALADATSVAMENVALLASLEERVRERTAALQKLNADLESFAHTAGHDLRGSLHTIGACASLLSWEVGDTLSPRARGYLNGVQTGVERLGGLLNSLLGLSGVSQQAFRPVRVDLAGIATEIVAELRTREPDREVTVEIAPSLPCMADPPLARVILENLLSNAWKYTSRTPDARITVGGTDGVYWVRDNGVGFDMAASAKLFTAFNRLHSAKEFPGTGVGLATVARIVDRHGGRIWVDARPGEGAVFSFTLPDPDGTTA